jgi:protein-tyrosine phosphatase
MVSNGVIYVLGGGVALLLSIGILWFVGVRLIGRGTPFVNPETFVRYTQQISSERKPSTIRYKQQRILKLQGAANFRDLGGYQNANGQSVKWGLVYRSEALGYLTDNDLSHLSNLGLRLVCDLRTPGEITALPDRVPQTAQWKATPAQEGDFDTSMLPTLLFNRKIIPELMRMSYPKLLADNPQRFGAVLTCFANPQNLPAVFHCTAGKDRAGLVAALLLGLLGVPDNVIVEDYTLSNLAFDSLFDKFISGSISTIRHFGIPLDELHPMLIADPVWMEEALAYLNETYGSIQSYLQQAAGMDADVIERIRYNLLE